MFQHETVLLQQTVDALHVHDGGTYVDATFGRGGHTRYLLAQGQNLQVFAFDRDQSAIDAGQKLLEQTNKKTSNHLELIKANFTDLASALDNHLIDGILYDLGVSSPQFDDPKRGFSYRYDARLDMRMDQTQDLDAYQIVNTWTAQQLIQILHRYGDEKFAQRIANNIIQQRSNRPILTTLQLSEIVNNSIPAAARRKMKKNPSKKTFQAIRIAVNDELSAVHDSLEAAISLLKPQGIISVITFQSLEDKIVKQIFRQRSMDKAPRDLPVVPKQLQPELKLLTKKPILPSALELEHNRRSHSARLRIAQKN
ncbi:16S rRNA (cytosine(1402)-N(4))-methyltransferase RsmH [Bombilactobacillus thymidiniphilus]|uniref:Ribosomal RNA small subunit methyltransferase H n=1 Tax=Bombilactobacillus thymidiniphilus TaxID=2923363 RepID=A0ABY4PE38_9LACO|nr:16S rRNA (cytosine(1402)-N(4))-methyltransferase RsmH [Bombilactobacillus thymidiniphilus]UQS83797.1 16S rRNA (cytosine(1402)-N(4))-methyltransferase RsmH [Bombilactobacillus thymidiniphilus]